MPRKKFRYVVNENIKGRTPSNEQLLQIQGFKCFYCLNDITEENATRDHLFPKSSNKTLLGNKVLACDKCNFFKGKRYPSIIEISKAAHIYDLIGYEFIVQYKKIDEKIKIIMRYANKPIKR